MLSFDDVHQTHVSVDRIKLLVVVAKVVPNGNGHSVGIVLVAGRFGEKPPTRPHHGAGASRHNGRAFGRRNIHTGVNDVAPKKYATVAIICGRPIDHIRGDGAGKIKMIVG